MMNTANVTATTINAGTTATIMKTNSQQPLSLQTSGIIPAAAIITATNDRLAATTNNTNNNSPLTQLQNHENTASSSTTQSVTAFTIHAPTQSLQALPNNLSIGAGTSASSVQQTSIQAVPPANTAIIHPASIGLSGSTATPASVVCTATILPVSGQQVTAIPVGVTGPTVSVLKPVAAALPIAQRFQTTNVMTSSGPSAGSINALFIHHEQQQQQQQHAAKNQPVTHSATNAHHTLQPNSVINATVSVAGPTATVHQPIPSGHSTPTPLFIQTSSPAAPNSAILHSNATLTATAGHTNTAQVAANLTTITVPTSAAAQQQQQTQQQQQQQFQRLKVEDALSYLDQVKFKFNDQPQVYNDFLDIMKEFKSQSIDTPGVIQRVSTLFKGHPELIVGFNTFLPPGYKIEIHANDQVNVSMPNSTNVVFMSSATPVVQPTGVATSTIVTGPGVVQQQQAVSGNLPRGAAASSAATPSATSSVNLHQSQQGLTQTFSNSIQARDSANAPLASLANNAALSQPRAVDPHANRAVSHAIDTSNNSRPQHLQSATASTNSTSSAQNMATPQPGSAPVEFNHAINYVNKIKNRFQAQPEVYKQFLDILQSYQKEQRIKESASAGQKLLTESEVFTKVAKLFQHQEDLLQEFSQFLPDATGSSANAHSHHNSNLLSASTHGGSAHHNSLNSTNSASSNFNLQPGAQPAANNFSVSHLDSIGSPFANASNSLSNSEHSSIMKKPLGLSNSNAPHSNRTTNSSNSPNTFQNALRIQKRPSANISLNSAIDQGTSHVPPKRSKLHTPSRDSSIPDAGKYIGDLSEYAFFDKMRITLNSSSGYDNFLRCLVLYNNEILSRSELLQIVTPLFARCPDLMKRFKDMICIKEGGSQASAAHNSSHHSAYSSSLYHNSYSNNSFYSNSYSNNSAHQLEGLSHRVALMKDRFESDYVELDFNSCKRYGVSYRTIPKNSARVECSGRTPLCHEVLNDTLVSFPSWSEDSTFVSSRKTQFEEYIYRCEDERYELDHVIETNSSTIQLFDMLIKRLSEMSEEEKNNFRLDDSLGGRSEVIYKKAIRRLYGENASIVIDALKNYPAKTIPVVAARLSAKEEEWRDAQKQFNKIWREQLEKYYLKSLDHQGINFKQNDIKNLRTKSLMNDIESVFDARQKEQEKAAADSNQILYQPHIHHVYPDKSMIDVACNLIIHHVKRQTSIHKEDKQKIKQLMRHFIPDLFATPRGELSDDEFDEEEKNPPEPPASLSEMKKSEDIKEEEEVQSTEKEDPKPAPSMLNLKPDEEYSLFFVNDYWYYFFRLHYTLCERLSKMHKHALNLAAEEAAQKTNKEASPANLLRLRNNLDIEVEEYFPSLVEMVKQVLDGNLDSNQYEDTLREMFGIHAYISFTLDKLVSYCVRQLQHIVTDEVSQQCTEMYLEAMKSGSAGGLCITAHQRVDDEAKYQKKAEQALSDEHVFKIIVYKDEGKVTFEFLGSNEEEEESANEGDEESNSTQSSRTLRSSAKTQSDKWNELGDGLDIEGLAEKVEERLRRNPRFLNRCIRKSKMIVPPINLEEEDNEKETAEERTASADDDQMSADEPASSDAPNSSADKDESKPKVKHLALDNYKSVLVANEHHIYRSNALRKARLNHKKVSQHMYAKFKKIHIDWLEANCSDEQRLQCDSWLLSSDTTELCKDSNDTTTATTTSSNKTEPIDSSVSATSLAQTSSELPNLSAESSSGDGKDEKETEPVASDSTSTGPVPQASTPRKTLHRVTIDAQSRLPPYRSYCKYHFQ